MRARRFANLGCWLLAGGALLSCDDNGSGLLGVNGAATAYPGPQFPGAGTSQAGAAIAAGTPVISCDAPLPLPGGTFGPAPNAQGTQTCFYTATDPVTPAATVEWIVESATVGDLVHVRLTLNPAFVDNTYGDNAIGWVAKGPKDPMGGPMGGAGKPKPDMGPGGTKAAHTFKDLVGSDHAEIKLRDARGVLLSHFKVDYISESSAAPSGYGSLGVVGGEGKMLQGNASDIVAVSTSLERNLNTCGLGSYLESSPATDALYTPNAQASSWDYRVIYDVWVRRSAFAAGFGSATVDFVHASPSKAGDNTLIVTPGPCPPAWPPYCADPNGCCVEIDSASCRPFTPVPQTPTPSCTQGVDLDCPIGI